MMQKSMNMSLYVASLIFVKICGSQVGFVVFVFVFVSEEFVFQEILASSHSCSPSLSAVLWLVSIQTVIPSLELLFRVPCICRYFVDISRHTPPPPPPPPPLYLLSSCFCQTGSRWFCSSRRRLFCPVFYPRSPVWRDWLLVWLWTSPLELWEETPDRGDTGWVWDTLHSTLESPGWGLYSQLEIVCPDWIMGSVSSQTRALLTNHEICAGVWSLSREQVRICVDPAFKNEPDLSPTNSGDRWMMECLGTIQTISFTERRNMMEERGVNIGTNVETQLWV